jgi:hypothetical protein
MICCTIPMVSVYKIPMSLIKLIIQVYWCFLKSSTLIETSRKCFLWCTNCLAKYLTSHLNKPKQQHMKFNCPEGTTALQKLEFYVIFFQPTNRRWIWKKYKIKCAPIKNYYLVYHFISCWKKGEHKKVSLSIFAATQKIGTHRIQQPEKYTKFKTLQCYKFHNSLQEFFVPCIFAEQKG